MFSALAVLFLWLVWLIACAAVKNEYILPSFWEAMKSCGRLLGQAAFWHAFCGTLLRTVWAFLFSLLFGAGLALLASLNGAVRAFLSPLISVLRTVPTMAVILILLIWTNPRVAPVLVSLFVLFPSFYAATLSAIDDVRASFGDLARAFRVGAGRRLAKMYLPLAAPNVLRQSGAIFSMGLKITISGEVLSNTFHSLGGLMQEAKMFVEMPTLMALTFVSVLVGFALEGLCALCYRLIVRWKS